MRLRRSRILRRWGDFQRVRKEGKTFAGKHLVLGVLAAPEEAGIRFGFITAKRPINRAVDRNRVRRRLRAIVTEVGDHLHPGHHMITIARAPATRANFATLRAEWIRLAREAGALPAGTLERVKS